jgi:predicted AAA+ superfamily ATPase
MNVLWENYWRLIENLPDIYERKCYSSLLNGNVFEGIVGQRGVGKTTFLLYYLRQHFANSKQALYFSADHAYFSDHRLLDVVDQFYREHDGKFLCIDEIHRYPDWSRELKNIYDSYPGVRVVFSGSSSIDLVKSKFDLSRRALLRKFWGFSFREYLEVVTGKKFSAYSLAEIVDGHFEIERMISEVPRLFGHFKDYLQWGYYPFFRDFQNRSDSLKALVEVIDKSIYQDIASFYQMKTDSLLAIRKLLYFLAMMKPGELNVNRLANSLDKDNKTVNQYLQILYEVGLIRQLSSDRFGHAFLRRPEKVYIGNTSLLYALGEALGKPVEIGTIREIFALGSLEQAGYRVFYTDKGDFVCDEMTFEVGGKNKDLGQIKDVDRGFLLMDDVLVGGKRVIP